MVQLISACKKLCERDIAATPKCATIGTVKESFQASHGTDFIHVPKVFFLGQTSGKQVFESSDIQTPSKGFASGDGYCPKAEDEPNRQYIGGAGKD
jgi:hypothetical protein